MLHLTHVLIVTTNRLIAGAVTHSGHTRDSTNTAVRQSRQYYSTIDTSYADVRLKLTVGSPWSSRIPSS